MSSANTRIPEIVDQSAALAGTIAPFTIAGRDFPGVLVTYGCGLGDVDDPLRVGKKIQPAPPNPTEPFTHVSDMPTTANLVLGMHGETILTHQLPMRFFVQAEALDEVRAQLVSMYARYLSVFALHLTLNGTARDWNTLTYRLGHEADWAWLEMALNVRERLNIPTAA